MYSIERIGDYNTCCVNQLGAFNYNLLTEYEYARSMASKAQFEAQKGYIAALKYAKQSVSPTSPSVRDLYARLERGRTRTEAGIRKIFDVNQPEKQARAEVMMPRAIPSTGIVITPVITTEIIQQAPSKASQSSIVYLTPIPQAAKPEWPKMLGTRQVWSQEEINQIVADKAAKAEIDRRIIEIKRQTASEQQEKAFQEAQVIEKAKRLKAIQDEAKQRIAEEQRRVAEQNAWMQSRKRSLLPTIPATSSAELWQQAFRH